MIKPRTLQEAFGRRGELTIEKEELKLKTALWILLAANTISLSLLFIFEVIRGRS